MQVITQHAPFIGMYAPPSICTIRNQYGVITPLLKIHESLTIQALKIEACRNENMPTFIALILENMGYREIKAKKLSDILDPFLSGKMELPEVSQTSSLGKFFREFHHRRKAFERIHRYLGDVSETILEDVAFPLSRKLRKEIAQDIRALQCIQKTQATSLENADIYHHQPEYQHFDSTSLFDRAQKEIYSLGSQLASLFTYIDMKLLSFPTASAESLIVNTDSVENDSLFIPPKRDLHSESCEDDLFSEASKLIYDQIEEMQKIVESQIRKANKKNCLRVLGYSGAGKSTWINYLFSQRCKSAHINGVNCDVTIANTGSSTDSETKHLSVYPITNRTDFAENTVIVDFPGLAGQEKNELINFVQSILTAKSIVQVGEIANSVVDVIIIEASTLESKSALSELMTTLSLKENIENRVLIITKAQTAKLEGVGLSNRKSIIDLLIEKGVDPTFANEVILYHAEDKDYALNATYPSGGGLNKKAMIETLLKLQNKAMKQIDNLKHPRVITIESLLTRTINADLFKISKCLQNGLKKTNKSSIRKVFERVNLLTKIDYQPLTEIVDDLLKEIDWNGIENESQKQFKNMLSSGNSTSFLQHFESEVLFFKTNKLTEKKFNQINFISHYVNALLEASHIHENFEKIESAGKSNIFRKIHQAFPDFPAIFQDKIFVELQRIEKKNKDSSLKCDFFIDNESKNLKKLLKILELNIGENHFEKAAQLIEKVDASSEQLKKIQELVRIERDKIIDGLFKSLRNGLILTPSLGYLFYNFFLKPNPNQLRFFKKWKSIFQNVSPKVFFGISHRAFQRTFQRIFNSRKKMIALTISTLTLSRKIIKTKEYAVALLNYLDNASVAYLRSRGGDSLINHFMEDTINHRACEKAKNNADTEH